MALDKDRVTKAFERIDELLASSAFLVGDRFSRADITLAALTALIGAPTSTRCAGLRPSATLKRSRRFGQVCSNMCA